MIVETTQCAGLRGVSDNVLPLIRKMISTHAYHSFGLPLKRFKIPLLALRHYTWQVHRNIKFGCKRLQTLTQKKYVHTQCIDPYTVLCLWFIEDTEDCSHNSHFS